MTPPTISEEYRAEQQRLHANENYGVASSSYAPLVRALLDLGQCASLSDYGAGKCNLKRELGENADAIAYHPFDPAFPDYGEPKPADLVACIDVLEHLEPDLLDACLDEIAAISRRLVLLTVHTGPAKKILSDGRNAHLIQEPIEWWLPRFGERFDLIHAQPARKGFFVLACPKGSYGSLAAELDLPALVDTAAAAAPSRRGKSSFKRSANAAKLAAGTLWLAARHRETPWYVKVIAGVSAIFALSPIDLTPDFIPVVGYFDDIALLFLGTYLAKRLIPPDLWAELRRRAATVDYARAMRGAAAVLALWAGGTAMAVAHIWTPLGR